MTPPKAMLHRTWAGVVVGLCLVQCDAGPACEGLWDGAPSRTYEYVYPYNTEQLNENHFIVLECAENMTRGWYYGTSDDFDRGREGYLPGFFVVEMQGLAVSQESIRFTIQVSEEDYFETPVPRVYRSAAEVASDSLEKWRHAVGGDPREYEGTITSDSITLGVDGMQRSFRRLLPRPESE